MPIRPTDSALFLVNPGWCEAPAIAHRGISRFRVRCFASPLHDSEHTSAISRRETPELCRIRSPRKQGRRECRTLGASAAACALVESTRVSHHGHTGKHPAFPAQWFYGFLRALPGDRACLPPSPTDHSVNLTPASGRQDHTTSPSALALFVNSASASTASRPASVTIAKRPSKGGGTRGIKR